MLTCECWLTVCVYCAGTKAYVRRCVRGRARRGSDAVWMGREFQTASHVILHGSHVLELLHANQRVNKPSPSRAACNMCVRQCPPCCSSLRERAEWTSWIDLALGSLYADTVNSCCCNCLSVWLAPTHVQDTDSTPSLFTGWPYMSPWKRIACFAPLQHNARLQVRIWTCLWSRKRMFASLKERHVL